MKMPWTQRRATPAMFTHEGSSLPLDGASAEARPAKKTVAGGFPAFHSTAGDQLNARSPGALAAYRMRLRNAYTPSQPVTDWSLFAGRTEILTGLIRAIEDSRLHAVLYGERGIGKTSILHVLAQSARRARYLVSYVSCGATSNFDEMFRAVAQDLPLLYHSAYGPTSPEAEKGATLADLLPEGEVSVRQASDLCAKLIGTRVLVILDEFDRCESREFRLNVAEFLKNLSDRSVRLQLIIAGVAHNLTELVEHVPSVQRNVFALETPPLSAAEARQLVKTGEASSGMSFAEDAIAMIVSVSNGLPYLTSLISHHAGLNALDAGRTEVTRQDALNAITVALGELWGRISKRGQTQIQACLDEGADRFLGPLAGLAQLAGGEFDTRAIETVADGADKGRVRAFIDRLADHGVVLQARDDDTGRHFRFVEASAPIYLWLHSAKVRAAAQTPAEPEKLVLDRAERTPRSAERSAAAI